MKRIAAPALSSLVILLAAAGGVAQAERRLNEVPPPNPEAPLPAPAYAFDSSTGVAAERVERRNEGLATPGMNVYVPRGRWRAPAAMSPQYYLELSRIGPYDDDARDAWFQPQPDTDPLVSVAPERRAYEERVRRNASEVVPSPSTQAAPVYIERPARTREYRPWDYYSWSLAYGSGAFGFSLNSPTYPAFGGYGNRGYYRPWCATSLAFSYSGRRGWSPGFGLNCW
ncbi:MAG: hypothetical protein RLZZ200_2655 [Pseudomonadota bacterium]